MGWTRLVACCVLTVLSGAAGCKEDPPPPAPEPAASASGKTASKARADVRRSTAIPRVSPLAMKIYRVEGCYYGSLAMAAARDVYLASLGGAEPSATKLPSFAEDEGGEAGAAAVAASPSAAPSSERAARAASSSERVAGPAPGLASAAASALAARPAMGGREMGLDPRRPMPLRPMAWVRHVRSCSIAKNLREPAAPELDERLKSYDDYASKLTRLFNDAHRYFSRKEFERDSFEKGKQLHKDLLAELGRLDAELAALGKTVTGWRASRGALPEELDKGGELGTAMVTQAHAFFQLLVAQPLDLAAARGGLDALRAAGEALEQRQTDEQGKEEAHVKQLGPKVKPLLAAAERALAPLKDKDKKAPATSFGPLALTMADLVEIDHRAVAQLVRKRGETSAPPRDVPVDNPHVRPGDPDDRPPPPPERPAGD
jgi:hypothetical protein